MHITEGNLIIFNVVRLCFRRTKILHKEQSAIACIFDVLRGIYSWTGLLEGGVSGQRTASELLLLSELLYVTW
jgi:hypothetical protein